MVKEAGFDLLVLCAEEFQPPASLFPGVKIIHAPLDDTDIRFRPHDEATAKAAAKRVADAMRAHSKVLVACAQGRNRSGLVVGLALLDHAYEPLRAVDIIKSRRANALTNVSYVDLLTRTR
jgi:protein-tyrosine phosphatase